MFDFSKLATTSFVSNSAQYLKAYNIYRVKLTKFEKTTLKGSKNPNAVYPVIAIEFTSTDKENPGVFSENLFIPLTEEDSVRPTFKNSEGHEYNRPSRFENFQYTLMHIVETLNPDAAEKIKTNASKIKSMDQFIDLIVKAVSSQSVKNKETNLKLVGRETNGTIYAALPKACGLSHEGEIFATNFLGENLFFTNYEQTQQKKLNDAKPTDMSKEDPDLETSNEDFNIDDIEL